MFKLLEQLTYITLDAYENIRVIQDTVNVLEVLITSNIMSDTS